MITQPLTSATWWRWILILSLILLGASLIGLWMGPQPLEWENGHLSATSSLIVWQLRLPRVLLGILVGMALGAGGTSFQALLRNPLADPYILGVSGGAALGSVIGVITHMPFLLMVAMAFSVSIATMLIITWAVGQRDNPHTLLLTGVIFNAFAFALIMLLHATVSMQEAHEILFLLIGSLEMVRLPTVAWVAICVVPPIIWLSAHGQTLNILCMGHDTAQALGIRPKRAQSMIFIAASIMIGAVVAVSGLIGFVGLFIPHIVRLTLGSDHRLVIPASALLGGSFLVIADVLARSILVNTHYQTELPVGVLTALIGGPIFVYLLRRELSA